MRITLRQLEIFHAICQEGTVTAAGQRIGLSQAAVSQAIAELENLLERPLFDRRGKRIVLNSAGKQLLPSAVEILDRVKEIEGASPDAHPKLRLSASLTVGDYMLPPIIAKFLRTHTSYEIHLSVGNTDAVIDALLRFESDAGWIEGHAQHPDLKASAWRQDELVVVAHPDSQLANHRATPKQLSAASWVLRERGSGTRSVFENAVAGKFEVKSALELGGIEAVKRTVMQGAGLGCVSRWAVASELRSGHLAVVRTPWLNLKRQIVLLVHKSRYVDAALQEFLAFSSTYLS